MPTKRARRHQKHQAAYNRNGQRIRVEEVTRQGGPYYADPHQTIRLVLRQCDGGKRKVLAYWPGRSPGIRRVTPSKNTPHGWCIRDIEAIIRGRQGIHIAQFDGQVLLEPKVLLQPGRDYEPILDQLLPEKRGGPVCRPDIQVRDRATQSLVCIIEVRWSSGISAENRAFYSRLGINVVQISARTWANVRGTGAAIPAELAWGPIASTSYHQPDLFEAAVACPPGNKGLPIPRRSIFRRKAFPSRTKVSHTASFRVSPVISSHLRRPC